jgi:hypothetical protein
LFSKNAEIAKILNSGYLGIFASTVNTLSYTWGLYFSTHATIEESTIYPTAEQALSCLRLCQMLSNCYRDIQLFRFNAQTGEVYIFAGDELQIIVSRNGLWRFLDETEL